MNQLIAVVGGFTITLASFAGGAVLATTHLVAEPVQNREQVDAASIWTSEPVKVENMDEFQRLPARPVSPAAPKEIEVASVEEPAMGVDMMTTAAVAPDAAQVQEEQMEALGSAHLDWCASRYRSFRAQDNSYQPYSGGRQPCVSPYLEEMQAIASAPADEAHPPVAERTSGHSVLVTDAPDPDHSVSIADDGRSAATEQARVADAVEEPVAEEPTVQYADAEADYVEEEFQSASHALDARLDHATWDHVQSCFERYRSYRPEDNSYQPYGGGPRRQCQ